MYLAMRFQQNLLSPLKVLYCSLFALVAMLLANPSLQTSIDAWLLSHGSVVMLVKMSFLVLLLVLNFKRLAFVIAIAAMALQTLGLSLASSSSCLIMLSVLLLCTLLVEITKLVVIDRYYQNKSSYDLLGALVSFGIVVAIV